MERSLGYLERVVVAVWRNHYRFPPVLYGAMIAVASSAFTFAFLRDWGISWQTWGALRTVALSGLLLLGAQRIIRWHMDRASVRRGVVVTLMVGPVNGWLPIVGCARAGNLEARCADVLR